MEDLLQIGVITKTHGVHGEVRVFPMTDDIRRFKKLKKTLVETKDGYDTLECVSAKFFKQFAILAFKDHGSIESIEKYCGHGIFVTRADAVKPGKDEYFIADLIGLKVKDEDAGLAGEITDVIQTGANDVYSIELDDGRQLLLPAIKECVLDVDIKGGMIRIHVLDGLLD
ncbi:MAG: ribosome maturation factor RimM [Lachnospiraceae bacterium]|nr:ribosome maturation factor RimM [Lachnospiraceae bacterium]